MVSSETGGIIKEVVKDKGEYVREGDTIIILDNASLRASMDAAKAQYELAEARFQKQQKVFNDNVGSEFEFLNAKYTRDQLKAVYEQTKVAYEKTFIKAPFNGIVDSRYFEEGEFLPPAVAVVRVLEPSKLKIEAGIPERYAGDIKNGADAEIFIKELFKDKLSGKVSFVGKALNPSNRTFPIEIVINNKNGLIKPDMLAEVSVAKGIFDDVVIIPEEVVTRSDSSYIAFVENNGKAELRNINILSRIGESVVVDKGLNDGDKLIVFGFQNLVNNEHVTIVN
jgi:RND family efflux transporter MFP subunit